jgi:hypothetical protein
MIRVRAAGLVARPDPSPGIRLLQNLSELVLHQVPYGDNDAQTLQRAFQLPAVPVELT